MTVAVAHRPRTVPQDIDGSSPRTSRPPRRADVDLAGVPPTRHRSPFSGAVPRSEPPAMLLRAGNAAPAVVDLSAAVEIRRPRCDGRPSRRDPPNAPLPDPTALCCAVVRSAVEVLRGERSVGQLVRWVSPEIFDALSRRARLTAGPASSADASRASRPVAIVRARTVRIGDYAAEATVIVNDRDRVRAAAVRLEARRGIWRVVAMEIG